MFVLNPYANPVMIVLLTVMLAVDIVLVDASTSGNKAVANENPFVEKRNLRRNPGQWNNYHLFVPYNLDENSELDPDDFGPEHYPYNATDPLRQHLHIFQNPSQDPSPVFFFSHANGGTAKNFGLDDMTLFDTVGYSVISWESVSMLDGDNGSLDVETCWNDFELVWSWFKANADSYNFDPDSVIIGARSRGTLCSWPMAFNSSYPEIKGVYMYNALPDSAWGVNYPDNTNVTIDIWKDFVTPDSPETLLVYGPDCPTDPPMQDCVPVPFDGHNPRHGQTIVDTYDDLDIGDRITLIDGRGNSAAGIWGCFPSFVYYKIRGLQPPDWAQSLCNP